MDRSAIMRRVKGANTKPELRVRALLRAMGYPGYRLHRRDLPGSPDMAYVGRKRAIFVHGCFWHGHDCARGARRPKANAAYWRAKIERNQTRDAAALAALAQMGWECLVIWECDLRDDVALQHRISGFLAKS